jgi:hypothetical protein
LSRPQLDSRLVTGSIFNPYRSHHAGQPQVAHSTFTGYVVRQLFEASRRSACAHCHRPSDTGNGTWLLECDGCSGASEAIPVHIGIRLRDRVTAERLAAKITGTGSARICPPGRPTRIRTSWTAGRRKARPGAPERNASRRMASRRVGARFRNPVKKNPLTGASALCAVVVLGLTLGGLAALLSPPPAFADTSTSTSGTNCVVTGSSATSGTAVSTSPSVEPVSTAPSQTDLAFTGADLAVAAGTGLLLVGAGVLLVLCARAHRRRGAKVLGCAVLGVLFAHQLLPAGQASAATNCASPPAVLPEVPNGILLPLAALVIFAAAYVWLRRRRAVS